MIFENCKVDRYHDFTVFSSPYKENGTNQVETCKLCGEMKKYTFNAKGQMRNERQYFLDHIRAFAQHDTDDKEMTKAFNYCNPVAAAKFAAEALAGRKSEDFRSEMSDKFKWAIKRAMNNQGWTDNSHGFDRSSSEK